MAPFRGTEEFYTQTATHLNHMGHHVRVFYDGLRQRVDGADYLPRNQYKGDCAALLVCNTHPSAAHPNAVRWTNLATDRIVNMPAGYKAHVVISPYARDLFGGGSIVGHGYDPEEYFAPVPSGSRDPIVFFTSSPDRGGDFLRSIAPRVYRATGHRFVFAYDGKRSEREMATLYRKAAAWVHPGLGTELFCISALKAQISGAIPVVVPNQALATTVRFGVKTTLNAFADDLIGLLNDRDRQREIRGLMAMARFPTWGEVTAELERVLCS